MGCGISTKTPKPGRDVVLQSNQGGNEVINDLDLDSRHLTQYRRQALFTRSASSSASSLNNAALQNSQRKKKKKKRKLFVNANRTGTSDNGVEISNSIIERVILDPTQLMERMIKEDALELIRINEINNAIISPPPSSSRSTSMSRYFARRAAASSTAQDDGAGSLILDEKRGNHKRQASQDNLMSQHRRQVSTENLFARLGGVGGSSSLSSGLTRKSQSVENLLGTPATTPGALVQASPSVPQTPILTAPSIPSSIGSHRRQGSEQSMFARIVRVSSLNENSEPPPMQPSTASTKSFYNLLCRENGETNLSEEHLDEWKTLSQRDVNDKFLTLNDKWTLQQIQDYLYSDNNKAKDESILSEHHNMNLPLTEYFISTSHNTYLFGGQWVYYGGRVDLQMYAKAIRQGCRCVEIDVYDGPDLEPIVTHVNPTVAGGSCTFLEVCAVIAKEAFRDGRGNLPLILNLENNMRLQSKRAAEILTGVFGVRLVRTDDSEFGWERDNIRTTLPTPTQLAGRVLCRSKPRESSEEYQNLIYLRNSPWKFSNVDDFIKRKIFQTSSLSESKVKGALRKLPRDFTPLELNHMFLNRVYPRSSAYNSQNFNPLPLWLLGFQLVALNFQTEGLEMDLHRCMFERNCGSGFVTKPVLMRRSVVQGRITNGGVRLTSSRSISKVNSNSPSVRTSLFLSSATRSSSRLLAPTLGSNENHNKSFMGVVEQALDNQNEDEDPNEEEEDNVVPPPPNATGPPIAEAQVLNVASMSQLLAVASPSSTSNGKIRTPKAEEIEKSLSRLDSNESDNSEKLRRLRIRRKSTGSILKSGDDEGSSRTLQKEHSTRRLSSDNPFPIKEETNDTIPVGVALNSVLFQFISVKCNIPRERGKSPRKDKFSENDDDDTLDEEVYVEVSVDGNLLDRMERKTVGTVQLRGTGQGLFADTEEIACFLKDSETALFTIRLVDAWDSNVLATRTFFAHTVRKGRRELILLGDSSGFCVPYTVTCKIETMYSRFSEKSGQYELEDDALPGPELPVPSKISMIQCVIIGARSENAKIKLSALDTFVNLQVIGTPIDLREVRSPKAKPKTVDSITEGNSTDCVTWMFPTILTFAWSEFAFLRFSLRTNVNIDLENGVVYGSSSTRAGRRGSFVFRQKEPVPGVAQENPTVSLLENGFTIGKALLWADAIRPGYRSVALHSEKSNSGEMTVATLLCHFTLFRASDETFGPNLDDLPASPQLKSKTSSKSLLATKEEPDVFKATSSSKSLLSLNSSPDDKPSSSGKSLSMSNSPDQNPRRSSSKINFSLTLPPVI